VNGYQRTGACVKGLDSLCEVLGSGAKWVLEARVLLVCLVVPTWFRVSCSLDWVGMQVEPHPGLCTATRRFLAFYTSTFLNNER
jgi:hypothetical protein